jgi:hypothetical protein
MPILKCKSTKTECNSEYQDQLYGKGMRVMNKRGKNKVGTVVCTVCGQEHTLRKEEK